MSLYAGPAELAGEILGVRSPALTPMQEDELAAELLAVQSEQELDRFLGALARDVWAKTQRGYRNSSAAQQVMQHAKKVVPAAVGAGAGMAHAPRDVAQALSQGARHGLDWVDAKLWGGELEAVAPDEVELEIARRYVRFTRRAIDAALRSPRDLTPSTAARLAMLEAARRYAPGLERVLSASTTRVGTPSQRGRWVRQGADLVVDLG